MKFLIFLHEECGIDSPHDIRTWDKEMSAKFIDKQFLDEQILCHEQTRLMPLEMPSQPGCRPFLYHVKAITCDDERFFAIALKQPPDELTLSNKAYGELLKVDSLILQIGNKKSIDCTIPDKREKTHIELPSGIYINETNPEKLMSCADERNSIEMFDNAPSDIEPYMKKIIDLIKRNREELRMHNIFLDLENLQLDQKIPTYINIGCISPKANIFSVMNFADLNSIDDEDTMNRKLTCLYIAFGYGKIVKLFKWTPRLLDDILIIAKSNLRNNLTLQFLIKRNYFKLEHVRPVILGRLNSGIKNTFNIYQGLLQFFLKAKNCIFHSEQHYLLISRFNRKFYIYDPTGRLDNFVTDDQYGRSCLLQLDNLCNVTYLILKMSKLYDTSPFTLSELKCLDFQEISLKNCQLIKTRMKNAIAGEEIPIENEIIYDLDMCDEFVIDNNKVSYTTPHQIADSDLSNYNLISWNYDRFNNTEIVKKFVDQMLARIKFGNCLSWDEFINTIIDQCLQKIGQPSPEEENELAAIAAEQAALKDNFIDMPNNTAILITKREVNEDFNIFSANLAFVAIFMKHGIISEWNSEIVDYIYRIASIVQTYFEPNVEDVLDLRRFYFNIQLGCDELELVFTQITKIFEDRLRHEIQTNLKCFNLLLILSPNVSFVVLKYKEYYYYFDSNLRDTIEIWTYVQHHFGCVIRFHTLSDLMLLIKRYNNKKFDYYHVFAVEEHKSKRNDFYEDFISINLFKYHRRKEDALFKIQGTTCLPDRNIIELHLVRSCYFTSVYVILFIMRLPLCRWNSDIIDLAIKHGPLLKEQVESSGGSMDMYQKRFIENLAIDGLFINIFLQEVFVDALGHNMLSQMGYFFSKRNILLLQFINCSFVILKDFGFHLFDPYGTLEVTNATKGRNQFEYPGYVPPEGKTELVDDNNKASWIFFMKLNDVVKYVKERSILDENTRKGYQFWVLNIVSFAQNYNRINRGIELKPDNINYKCIKFDYEESIKSIIPNENKKWILDGSDYIPIWSRLLIKIKRNLLISRSVRYGIDLQFLWYNFQIEKENDIFSIWGTISPRSYIFGEYRNKQYHGICLMALFILNVYNLSEMTSNLIDWIVIEGDRYFYYSVEDIETPDYEVALADMVKPYKVGNFEFTWDSVELSYNNGVLFTCKGGMSKIIELFFNQHRCKYGIIQCNRKILAFGVDVAEGYFLFDAQSFGFPLFLDCQGCAYMLRTLSLKRLSYLIVRTLGIFDDDQVFVIHAVNYEIKLKGDRFYKGAYTRLREPKELYIPPGCEEQEEINPPPSDVSLQHRY